MGLAAAYDRNEGSYCLIRNLMALPFLPATEILPTFTKLWSRASTDEMQELVTYIDRTWVSSNTFPPRDGQSKRTNNDLEGWHHGLNRRDGGRVHIPFYLLVKHLHREATLAALQVRLVSERKLKRIQRQAYRRRQAKIFDLWDEYASSQKTGFQLLKACSHLNEPVRSNRSS